MNFAEQLSKLRINRIVKILIILLVSLSIYIFILVNRIPIPFRQISIQARYGFSLPVVFISILIFLALRKSGWVGELITFILILSIFGFALAGLWASGSSGPTVISGLIPIVDSENFYTDALRVVNGGFFSSYSTKRPLFAAYLSTILRISGMNMMIAHAVMAYICAAACFLSVIIIKNRFGVLSATIFFVLAFFYSRIYIGNFVTEILGIPLGLLGFSLYLLFEQNNSDMLYFFCIFTLSLAQFVRPGALFIPILIAIWVFFSNKNKKKNKLLFFILGFLGFAIPFFMNILIANKLGLGGSLPFSNYGHILYGLTRGGAGWSQIYDEHPEIFKLNEPELTFSILNIAKKTFQQEPFNFIIGIFKQYTFLLNPFESKNSLFSYMYSETTWISLITQLFFYVLSFLGIVYLSKIRQRPELFGFLIAFLGFLISIPIAPIQDFLYLRAYSASIGFLIIIPCFGIYLLQEKIFVEKNTKSIVCLKPWVNLIIGFTLFIIVTSIFLPIFNKNKTSIDTYLPINCLENADGILFYIYPGSYIKILPENHFFWIGCPFFIKDDSIKTSGFFLIPN